jgi:hypothetical protein
MQPYHPERRREPRFQIVAGATVEVDNQGRITHATTVNVSGCGVLLQFEEPVHVAVGDQVICEFKVPQKAGTPLPYWGLGNVLRVEDRRAAIDFKAALSPIEPAPDRE